MHWRVSRARPKRTTALYDATATALRRVKSAKQRKAVVVFTDGEDNRSRFSVDQVIEMARTSEVSVYTVAEGVSDPKTASFLERLASETGGRSYAIRHGGKGADQGGGVPLRRTARNIRRSLRCPRDGYVGADSRR